MQMYATDCSESFRMTTFTCNLIGFKPLFESFLCGDGDTDEKPEVTRSFHTAGNHIDELDLVCLETMSSSLTFETYLNLESPLEPTPIGPFAVVASSISSPVLPINISEIRSLIGSGSELRSCIYEKVSNLPFPRVVGDINHRAGNRHAVFQNDGCTTLAKNRDNLMANHATTSTNKVNESIISSESNGETFPPIKRLGPSNWMISDDEEKQESVDEIDSTLGEHERKERFRIYQNSQWKEKFDELVEYKAKTGHCEVPHNYAENPALAKWIKR
jgi:Helicase associated domain